jgi:hypothetical protein
VNNATKSGKTIGGQEKPFDVEGSATEACRRRAGRPHRALVRAAIIERARASSRELLDITCVVCAPMTEAAPGAYAREAHRRRGARRAGRMARRGRAGGPVVRARAAAGQVLLPFVFGVAAGGQAFGRELGYRPSTLRRMVEDCYAWMRAAKLAA